MLNEKSVSKSQQRLFGAVVAAQKGKKAGSSKIATMAKDMSTKDVKDFASTPTKGLPQKVKKEGVGREIRPMIENMVSCSPNFREFVKEFTNRFNAYPKTQQSIQTLEAVYNKHKLVNDQVQAQSGQEDLENDPSLYINSPDKQQDETDEQNIHTSNKLSLKTAMDNL